MSQVDVNGAIGVLRAPQHHFVLCAPAPRISCRSLHIYSYYCYCYYRLCYSCYYYNCYNNNNYNNYYYHYYYYYYYNNNNNNNGHELAQRLQRVLAAASVGCSICWLLQMTRAQQEETGAAKGRAAKARVVLAALVHHICRVRMCV
jgi:hypothetical protein